MKMALTAVAASGMLLAGCATGNTGGGWVYGDRVYTSQADCLAAKRNAQSRSAVAGAVGGAATGALLGGNLGETALAAGVGAAGGAALGGRNRPC